MALVMHYDWSHALQVLHPGKMWQVEMDKDDKQILHWDDPSPRPNEADLEVLVHPKISGRTNASS